MDFGIAGVAAITAIVYIIGLLFRVLPLDRKWIPSVCGITGLLLGLLAYGIGMPGFPGEDLLTAAAVGGVSGLAATGVDQAVKQLKR